MPSQADAEPTQLAHPSANSNLKGFAMTEQQPALQILTPDATPEEVAALIAVLSSISTAEPAGRPISEWSAHRRKLNPTYPHGPGGWRASGLPR